jgi:hypothetical protein
MVIHLCYNKEVSQWRWTLTDPLDDSYLECGNSSELKVALEEVGRTIEWTLDERPQEEWGLV